MKTDDLIGGGSGLTPPPPPECVAEPKIRQKIGEGEILRGPHKKSAHKYYLGIVKKFQNNRISHFLIVDFLKKWRSDLNPLPLRVNDQE